MKKHTHVVTGCRRKTHLDTSAHGTTSHTAGQPIKEQPAGAENRGKVERETLQQKRKHVRVEDPRCPSAADVKLRVRSLPLGGPREIASVSFLAVLLPFFFLSRFLMGSLFFHDSVSLTRSNTPLCTAERRRFDGRPLMFLSASRCCSPSLGLPSLSLQASRL